MNEFKGVEGDVLPLERIRTWEEKNRKELTERAERLEKYRITSGWEDEGKPVGIERGRMGREYQFKTADQGNWQIFIRKPVEYSPPKLLDDYQKAIILKKLTTTQTFPRGGSREENKHRRVIDFLLANWARLAGIFYPLEVAEKADLAGFSEVKLGERKADFIGIGPDGKYIVIEIGKKGKQYQLEGYKSSLEKMGIPGEMIMGFVIKYSLAARTTTLKIT